MNNLVVFKNIYTNIYKHDSFIDNYNKFFVKLKTARILNKITTIKDKYKYYEMLNRDLIFFLSQKHYFVIYNFIKHLKYKKYKIYNKYDLNYEIINNNDLVLNVYMNKFIYKFTISDIINIIKYNIYYYQDNSNIIDNSNQNIEITIQSNKIKNPYTNEILPISALYNLYHMLYFNNKSIPYILLIFYKSDFDIIKLNFDNRDYIIKNSLKQYTNNIDKTVKYHYFKNILIDFLKYLYVNVNYKSVQFTIIITITNDTILDKIINNIFKTNNNLIYNYIISRYYFNKNNASLSTYYRLINYNIIMTSRKLNIIKDIFGINNSILIYIILNSNNNDMFNRELNLVNNNINLNNRELNQVNNNINLNNRELNDHDIYSNIQSYKIYNIVNNLFKLLYNVYKITNNFIVLYYLLHVFFL